MIFERFNEIHCTKTDLYVFFQKSSSMKTSLRKRAILVLCIFFLTYDENKKYKFKFYFKQNKRVNNNNIFK